MPDLLQVRYEDAADDVRHVVDAETTLGSDMVRQAASKRATQRASMCTPAHPAAWAWERARPHQLTTMISPDGRGKPHDDSLVGSRTQADTCPRARARIRRSRSSRTHRAPTVRTLTLRGLTSRPQAGEFDVLPCAPGTPPSECVRRFEAVIPFDAPDSAELVELAWALPHVHESGIYLELVDALSNQTLCRASRGDGGIVYGNGTAAGDESGYIVGFRTCAWGAEDAPLLANRHPLRIIALYNASRYITGAMASFKMLVHPR